MSQVTNTAVAVRNQVHHHRIVVISALLAVLATAAVVLVLAIDGGSAGTDSVAQGSQPALRSDGGPNESSVAAAVGSRPSPYPDESRIAASLGR